MMRGQYPCIVIPDMVEGLLRQRNTMQGVVFQWGTGLGVAESTGLGVAEGRMCSTRGRHIVQSGRQSLVEAHEHLEGEVD